LLVWKIFPDKPNISDDFYVDGEHYLRALGEVVSADVKVVNLSIGGTARSETEAILFRRLEARNVTVVAAMGNSFEKGNPTMYPGGYDNVFAVGSIDILEQRSAFSQTGLHIDAVAPGSDILSTLPTRRSKYRDQRNYASWDGTSMATPHVAGVAALVWARFPTWTAPQIKDRLRSTCRRVKAMGRSKRSNAYGHGIINAESAVR
jgi:subtilisin